MKAVIILFFTASILIAAEATREGGLSAHMLPERIARISGEKGGFTVADPSTKDRGDTYAKPEELLAYFVGLPASVQQNGIWIVTLTKFYSRTRKPSGGIGGLWARRRSSLHCRDSDTEGETPGINIQRSRRYNPRELGPTAHETRLTHWCTHIPCGWSLRRHSSAQSRRKSKDLLLVLSERPHRQHGWRETTAA